MKRLENIHAYEDIINMPHYTSPKRPPMSRADRAAQFAPFAALCGFEEAIAEAARRTDQKAELFEGSKARIGDTLLRLQARIREQPTVSVTFFVPDEKKSGGRYETRAATVKKINTDRKMLILQDGTAIPFDDIEEIRE